jgi:arginase
MTDAKRVCIVGAPLDLGQSRRGVDMGPSAIRYSGLAERLEGLGIEVEDGGNVVAALAETAGMDDEHARYLPEILATCAQIGRRVAEAAAADRTPLVLGGDHSIAMGTLAGLAAMAGPGGVLWVDAHGDLNRPPTSPSGNVHGMPLAAALGACNFSIDGFGAPPWVDPSRVALIGIRELDSGEKEFIRERGTAAFTMSEIDRRGIGEVVREALDVVAGDNFVHLSLDVDVCDPEIAPGVGTPVRGGLSYREVHLAMELIAEASILTSMEVVELNPILDHANMTGELAVELIASALGARIL